MRITKMQVNHITNPLGFDLGNPAFSWVVENAKGTAAEASRIVVRRGEDVVADTGWGEHSSLATHIEGLADALAPRTRYIWTVAVRSDADEEVTSDPAWFETGKMDEPWQAQWLLFDLAERQPIASTSLALQGEEIASARLYVCGLGLYRATIDSARVGNEYLAPGTNAYDQWLQVQTYDVMGLVHDGAELAIELAPGWYAGRFGFSGRGPWYGHDLRLIAELHVTYADGHEQVVGTDADWQVARSNVTESSIYDGEHRDDTLPAVAPEAATLLDAEEAQTMTSRLHDRLSLPVTAHELFESPEVITTPAGETVVDLGQNIAGTFRLRVHEPAGTLVHVQVGELLQQGNFYRDNLRTAKAECVYVSDGEPHVLEPFFTYYGYRYAKVEVTRPGAEPRPAKLSAGDFVGVALYSDFDADRGRITTGHELVNKLLSNTRWGMKGNFVDTATDCPQRDERMGWTGDANVFSRTALYLGAPYAFYRKYLYDMAFEQSTHDGDVPGVIPSFGMGSNGAVWSDATTFIPWNMYQMEGDPAILAEHFDAMRAWVDYVERVDGDDHAFHQGRQLGDWLALDGHKDEERMGGTDEGFIADLYYWRSACIVADSARVLGCGDVAAHYDDVAERQAEWIRSAYYSPIGRCVVNTQTAYLLSLSFGFGDDAWSAQELMRLLHENGDKLATGFVGTPLLLPMLSQVGEHRRAYDLLLSEDYPGWLHCINLGATTIWERWNSLDDDGFITGINMNSMNHYAYGSVCQWIWETAAGITPEEPGFAVARIAPQPSWRLHELEAELATAAGTYRVAWVCVGEARLRVRITVPFGARAMVELPLAPESAYEELGGHELAAGTYEVEYDTTRPVRRIPTAGTPIAELLADHATNAVLRRFARHPDFLPADLQQLSLRELQERVPAEHLAFAGLALDAERLSALDDALRELAE